MVADTLDGVKESPGLKLPVPCAPTFDSTIPKLRVSELKTASATSVLLSILHAFFLGARAGSEDADPARDGREWDTFNSRGPASSPGVTLAFWIHSKPGRWFAVGPQPVRPGVQDFSK